jgi:hypothetical protein
MKLQRSKEKGCSVFQINLFGRAFLFWVVNPDKLENWYDGKTKIGEE